jgi:hypothetical protein
VNIVSPTVSDLQIEPKNPVALGEVCTGTVTLDRASLRGDVEVAITIQPPDFATIPNAPVPVFQGTTTQTFQITAPATIAPFGGTQGTVYASYAGTSVSALLTAVEAAASTGVLASVWVPGIPIEGGSTVTGSVTLEATVPDATIVTLSTYQTVRIPPGGFVILPKASVPPTTTVPAGQLSATFEIKTEPLPPGATAHTVGIAASAFVNKTAILTFSG